MSTLNKLPAVWKLILCILLCEATGMISSLFSDVRTNTWFEFLDKPNWFPPYFLFGLVWSVLYMLMGISLWLVWRSQKEKEEKTAAIQLFFIQLLFNFWWSIIFFRFQSTFFALVDIVLLLLCIALTMQAFFKISRSAGYLLVPYILWVGFATALNMNIWILNK